MSLTVYKSPPAQGGTRNPITIGWSSTNIIENTGIAHLVILTLSPAAADGDTWIIQWGENTATLTAKTSPTVNGIEFPAGTTDAATILPYVQANYLLDRDFIMTVSSTNRIQFLSKYKGSAYNTTTDTGTWAGGTQFQYDDGIDEIVRPNYQIWADLYLENTINSNDYGTVPIAQLSLSADTKNRFTTDLSELLDGYLTELLPVQDDIAIRWAFEQLKRYKIKYAEAYGVPIQPYGLTEVGPYYCLRGRKSYEAELTGSNLFSTGIMSDRPATKKVMPSQNEFLYLLTSWADTPIVRTTVYFTDGSVTTLSDLVGTGVPNFSIHVIPMGYTQLGVNAADPTKTVDYYTARISNVDLTFQVTYRFDVERTCPPHTRFFVFRNEQGGYDTIQAQGVLKTAIGIGKETAQRSFPENYDATDTDYYNYNVIGLDEYEVSTGYIFTKTEIEYYLRRFLMSENVLLQDSGGTFIPVEVTTTEAEYHRDNFNLYGFTFRFRRRARFMDRHTAYRK